jgi:RNA polymerase primary sigma factor
MKEDFSLEIYLKEIRKFSLLSQDEEREVVEKFQQGDGQARARLINSNLRLVVNMAKRYVNCGIPLADLIAEGNMGLIYAAERFRLAKGCRFSTYATFWIKHAICRAITEKNSLVRIPAYMKKILSDCKKKTEVLLKHLGHSPTVQEVVDGMAFSDAKGEIVAEGLFTSKALEGLQSLQTEQNEWLEDLYEQKAYTEFWDHNEVESIMDLLDSLEPKRAQIIRLRYGLDGGPTMTLKEIAAELRLTKERIRQIEKETLRMLRECLQNPEPDKEGCVNRIWQKGNKARESCMRVTVSKWAAQ